MKIGTYQALHDLISEKPGYTRLVTVCTKFLPLILYAFYPLFLLYILILKPSSFMYAVTVPASGFLICTVWRKLLNAPRPYEVMKIPAIVPKETSGKSFPSRHSASAAVIAVTVLPIFPVIGCVLLLLSLAIVVTRVLAGVHFIRDVVCGWLLGAGVGILGILIFR